MAYLARTRSLVAAVVLLAGAAGALAQQPADQMDNATLLKEFIHYTRIDLPDVAAAYGQRLLQRGLSPTAFVDLVETAEGADRFRDTIARAMRYPSLEGVAAGLDSAYDAGRKARARDPEEISRNIKLLTDLAGPRRFARERLAAAKEYAVPQLLRSLLQRDNPTLAAEAARLLVDMGGQSVVPLSTAVTDLVPTEQEQVIDILGLIGRRTALPAIAQVLATTTVPAVRSACLRAMDRMSIDASRVDAASLYLVLAEDYYNEKSELLKFADEEHQLIWHYDPSAGLHMVPVRTEVYHEAMAMRWSARSLELRPTNNRAAVALWVASNFSRETDTPAGYDNPTYGSDRRDATYYAVAAGSAICQDVLARAIDARDTPLARQAIAAIERTAGGSVLRGENTGGRQPLLEALRYPSRRVQFEAALALGKAQPRSPFLGSERVVPILGSAIRGADERYALIVARDEDTYRSVRTVLEADPLRYTVLRFGRSLGDLRDEVASAPGVDLIVCDLSSEATAELIETSRASARLGATPVLALATAPGYADLMPRYGRDPTVAIRPLGLPADALRASVQGLIERSSGGPITAEAARDYSARALAVLRDLAISRNAVLDAGDAAVALIGGLTEFTGTRQLDAAEVLALIDQPRAQVALLDQALAASGDQRISLLGKTSASARRFGNMLEPRQVQRVIEIARTGTGAEATAAAALMGALDLTNEGLVPMIVQGAR